MDDCLFSSLDIFNIFKLKKMNDLEVKEQKREQKSYGRGIGNVRGKDKREGKPSSCRSVCKLGIQGEQLLE